MCVQGNSKGREGIFTTVKCTPDSVCCICNAVTKFINNFVIISSEKYSSLIL